MISENSTLLNDRINLKNEIEAKLADTKKIKHILQNIETLDLNLSVKIYIEMSQKAIISEKLINALFNAISKRK